MAAGLPSGLGDVEQLIRRWNAAKAKRTTWDGYLSRAFKFIAPNRDTFFERGQAADRFKDVYDSTAILASRHYVNRLVQAIMPAWREWSLLRPGADYEDSPDAQQIGEALQRITEDMFRYLNHSNFYNVLPESCHDMTVTTGALKIEEGDIDNPFVCSAEPIHTLWFEEGPNGLIENVWRKPEKEASLLERLYPGIELTSDIREKLNKQESFKPELVEGTLLDTDSNEYWSFVISEKDKQVMWTQNYGSGPGASPWIIFREDKVAGEIMGRGRGLAALPDIMTANKMVEFELKNAALATAGAWTGISDGVLNPYTAVVAPSVIIPVASNSNQNPTLKPLERSGDFNVANLVLGDIRQAIKATFLNTQRMPDDKFRTAFRENLDEQDLLIEQGASFGRLQTELVDTTVRRLMRILSNLGLAPEIRIDGQEVTLKHTSPLSRAQDQSEILMIQQFFETGNATVGPEVMATAVKTDIVPEELAKRFGVPQVLIRDEAERTQVEEQMAAQLAAAAEQNPQAVPGV